MAFKKAGPAFIALSCLIASLLGSAQGYDASRSDNLAVYYGQNSIGASNNNSTVWQESLATYCEDDVINAIPLAFLHVFFSTGGLPEINLANICSSEDNVFPGTNLANCQFMAADIKACQAKGKIVTLSLGGATAAAAFSSDAQATIFGHTIWNLFLGGSCSTRPFGDAVLDGIDLDLEGGSGQYFSTFVSTIRSLSNGASKKYYITGAPQCPFPDAYLASIINTVGFDALYVQVFYNNWCGVQNFDNANAWNFGVWDKWAKTTSPNKNVKIFIGAPASSTAAGSGYVDAATLGSIATQMRSQYSSFGGIMLWDTSQAYGNNRYDVSIKNMLSGGKPAQTTTGGETTTKPTTTPSTPTACSGIAAWSASTTYLQGTFVTYNGHLWTNLWWTCNEIPGGGAGVWVDKGACSRRALDAPAIRDVASGELERRIFRFARKA